MDWFCQCGNPATGVGVIVLEVSTTLEKGITITSNSGMTMMIPGRYKLTGNVEFLPFCQDHDLGNQTAYFLKCELTDQLKKELEKKFPIDEVNQVRDVRIE